MPGSISASRRAFLRQASAGVAGVGFASWMPAARSAGGLEVSEVADGLSLVRGAGANILVRSTSAGQIVVDSGSANARNAVLATFDELPGDGVLALFDTHWHPEQVGANETIGTAGAPIFAHAKTHQRLAAGYYLQDEDRYERPLPPAALPTETFFDGVQTTQIAGLTIDYGYLIEAHTDGDIFIAFPDINVIAVGDALSPERDPVFDWFGGGWLGGRLDSIDLLLERSDDETLFVPGVGPVIGRTEVLAERDLYVKLFDLFVEHIRLGETTCTRVSGPTTTN
jgi:cyclase